MEKAPCRLLEWDSSFFGHRIAVVESKYLTSLQVKDALDWCRNNRIRCLYFLSAPDDDRSVYEAESNGFHLVDLRVELLWRKPPSDIKASFNAEVRPLGKGDRETLLEIAQSAHPSTRFYFDKHFTTKQASSLYRTWLAKACDDEAQQVFVSDKDGEVVGYVTCHLESDRQGSIGLIGVSSKARGSGVGSSLVMGALQHFTSHEITEVRVVTQGRNLVAQKLYQNCGFRTNQIYMWYHKWFDGADLDGKSRD